MFNALKTLCLGGIPLAVTVGCTTIAVPAPSTLSALSDAEGYEGRIRLVRFLDEPDGYCLDVPGPAGGELLHLPVVAHTCHPDPYADQVFSFNHQNTGYLRWTTEEHDLCYTADKAESGSKLNLRSCEGGPMQVFEYTAGQEFKLSGSDLCIQVERRGAGQMQPPGEGQDAYGRGRSVNAQYTHLMRFLELHTCGEGDPAMSRWKAIK